MRATMSCLSPWCDCAFALERRPVPTIPACRRVPTEGDDDGSGADFPPQRGDSAKDTTRWNLKHPR